MPATPTGGDISGYPWKQLHLRAVMTAINCMATRGGFIKISINQLHRCYPLRSVRRAIFSITDGDERQRVRKEFEKWRYGIR